MEPSIFDDRRDDDPYLNESEYVRSKIASYFTIYEVKEEKDGPIFYCQVMPETLEERFDILRKELWEDNYIPFLDFKGGEYTIRVVKSPKQQYKSTKVNLIFLMITIITASFAGAWGWHSYANSPELFTLDNFTMGILFFTFPLLAILAVHEMGHYFMAKKYNVAASLPFFIPFAPPLGTMGAFISIREPIPNKRALLDIGAAGPIAGFLVAVPVSIIGLWLTAQDATPIPLNPGDAGGMSIHLPLLYHGLTYIFPLPANAILHPTAFAGWVGFFVTALNLLPMGQLDGGHIFRALLGKKSHLATYAVAFALVALSFLYTGWIIIVFLVLFLGMKHPPPLDDITPLTSRQWMAGGMAVFLLISCFVPVPLELIEPEYNIGINDINGEVLDQLDFNSTNLSYGFAAIEIENTGNTFLQVNLTSKTTSTLIREGWDITVEYKGASWELHWDDNPSISLNSSEKAVINITVSPPPTAVPGNNTLSMGFMGYSDLNDNSQYGQNEIVRSKTVTIYYEIEA